MSPYKSQLYEIVRKWERSARIETGDKYPYQSVLDEVLFHSDLRFDDYLQFQDAGPFSKRLKLWLDNLYDENHKKILFRFLEHIVFIDKSQMLSLYRDSFRRMIVPWIAERHLSTNDMLNADYKIKVISSLKRYKLLTITESFCISDLLRTNDIVGMNKPIIIGEERKKLIDLLPIRNKSCRGLIIFEDFVGTGNKALKILEKIAQKTPSKWKLLFIPLIILEKGYNFLEKVRSISKFQIKPILVVPNASCISRDWSKGENRDFVFMRPIINITAKRVLEKLNNLDDAPKDPFGYKGSGAFVIAYHNTPNNSLPLIHHKSPSWSPLFRRLHHSKDGLS
jgi:hypothetical protein